MMLPLFTLFTLDPFSNRQANHQLIGFHVVSNRQLTSPPNWCRLFSHDTMAPLNHSKSANAGDPPDKDAQLELFQVFGEDSFAVTFFLGVFALIFTLAGALFFLSPSWFVAGAAVFTGFLVVSKVSPFPRIPISSGLRSGQSANQASFATFKSEACGISAVAGGCLDQILMPRPLISTTYQPSTFSMSLVPVVIAPR